MSTGHADVVVGNDNDNNEARQLSYINARQSAIGDDAIWDTGAAAADPFDACDSSVMAGNGDNPCMEGCGHGMQPNPFNPNLAEAATQPRPAACSDYTCVCADSGCAKSWTVECIKWYMQCQTETQVCGELSDAPTAVQDAKIETSCAMAPSSANNDFCFNPPRPTPEPTTAPTAGASILRPTTRPPAPTSIASPTGIASGDDDDDGKAGKKGKGGGKGGKKTGLSMSFGGKKGGGKKGGLSMSFGGYTSAGAQADLSMSFAGKKAGGFGGKKGDLSMSFGGKKAGGNGGKKGGYTSAGAQAGTKAGGFGGKKGDLSMSIGGKKGGLGGKKGGYDF
ncbi:MAG: hypothetical protein SGARI_001544 [Bacillariaceae sp.]